MAEIWKSQQKSGEIPKSFLKSEDFEIPYAIFMSVGPLGSATDGPGGPLVSTTDGPGGPLIGGTIRSMTGQRKGTVLFIINRHLTVFLVLNVAPIEHQNFISGAYWT